MNRWQRWWRRWFPVRIRRRCLYCDRLYPVAAKAGDEVWVDAKTGEPLNWMDMNYCPRHHRREGAVA